MQSLSWFGNQSREMWYAQQVVEGIKESPLLTEEDFQLLHFTTNLPKWPSVSTELIAHVVSYSVMHRVSYSVMQCHAVSRF